MVAKNRCPCQLFTAPEGKNHDPDLRYETDEVCGQVYRGQMKWKIETRKIPMQHTHLQGFQKWQTSYYWIIGYMQILYGDKAMEPNYKLYWSMQGNISFQYWHFSTNLNCTLPLSKNYIYNSIELRYNRECQFMSALGLVFIRLKIMGSHNLV